MKSLYFSIHSVVYLLFSSSYFFSILQINHLNRKFHSNRQQNSETRFVLPTSKDALPIPVWCNHNFHCILYTVHKSYIRLQTITTIQLIFFNDGAMENAAWENLFYCNAPELPLCRQIWKLKIIRICGQIAEFVAVHRTSWLDKISRRKQHRQNTAPSTVHSFVSILSFTRIYSIIINLKSNQSIMSTATN